MNSRLVAKFRKHFDGLPQNIQDLARQAYRLWRREPWHNSLQFKQMQPRHSYYSVRIGAHYRAVGLKTGNEVIWLWVGTHAEYDALLKQL